MNLQPTDFEDEIRRWQIIAGLSRRHGIPGHTLAVGSGPVVIRPQHAVVSGPLSIHLSTSLPGPLLREPPVREDKSALSNQNLAVDGNKRILVMEQRS